MLKEDSSNNNSSDNGENEQLRKANAELAARFDRISSSMTDRMDSLEAENTALKRASTVAPGTTADGGQRPKKKTIGQQNEAEAKREYQNKAGGKLFFKSYPKDRNACKWCYWNAYITAKYGPRQCRATHNKFQIPPANDLDTCKTMDGLVSLMK